MELLTDKTLWGIIASIISFAALIPYMRGIVKGITVPHVISWFIWGISTLTVFAAQWLDDGGAGSWSTAVGGGMTFVIIALAIKHNADLSIKCADWVILALCLLALPLWYLTDDALLAVLLLTTIDLLAYLPTIRKSWHKPHEEQLLMFIVMTGRNAIATYSLEHYSAVTLLFPVATAIANILLISMIMLRRRHIAQ